MAGDCAFRKRYHAKAPALCDAGADAGVLNADDRTACESRGGVEARLRIARDHESRGVGAFSNERGDALSRNGDIFSRDDLSRILRNGQAFDGKRRKRRGDRILDSPRDSLDAVRIDDDNGGGHRCGKNCHDRRCSKRAMSRTTGHSATR